MHLFPLFATWWRWWIHPSSQLQHKCVLIDSHESRLNLEIQSAKDYVPALIDAGVGCFKIEGRLKGEETDRGTSKLQTSWAFFLHLHKQDQRSLCCYHLHVQACSDTWWTAAKDESNSEQLHKGKSQHSLHFQHDALPPKGLHNTGTGTWIWNATCCLAGVCGFDNGSLPASYRSGVGCYHNGVGGDTCGWAAGSAADGTYCIGAAFCPRAGLVSVVKTGQSDLSMYETARSEREVYHEGNKGS